MSDRENQNEESGARRKFWEWQDWLDRETERLKEKKGRVIDPTAPQSQASPDSEYTPPPTQGVRSADHYARVISSAFPEAETMETLHREEEQKPEPEKQPEPVPEDPRDNKFDKHLDELFSSDRVINIPVKRAFRHNTDHLEKKKTPPKSGSRRLNVVLGPLALLSWLTEMLVHSQK